MKIDWLRPLLGQEAPFTTVHLDVTGEGEPAAREARDRWRGLRRQLAGEGAPEATLDLIEEALTPPTGAARGRVVIANPQGILVDRTLTTAPTSSSAVHGPVPDLLPAARYNDEVVDHIVARVDRSGADLVRRHWGSADGDWHATVEGGHDDIEVSQTGPHQSRGEARQHDSWERNAEVVAQELDRLCASEGPEVIILTGDVRAVALVKAELGQKACACVLEVPGGSRSAGAHEESFEAHVNEALDGYRTRRTEKVLARYREGHGRQDGAVTSLADVVDVLTKGQVAELVLADDPARTAEPEPTLWVGLEPLHLAVDEATLSDMGLTDLRQMPASIALVRAALGQDAGLTFAPDGAVDLRDGVGAVLRWSDSSTPHESAPSLSSDAGRLSAHG